MHSDLVRRGIIFVSTIFVHCNNICIMGLCEPVSQHEALVVADRASVIFTLAIALALFDAELWPRRKPFRPMPSNMIFCLELTITLVIANLMLRIIWLPFVHVALLYINCTISDVILKANSYVFPRGKNNSFAAFASSTCSPGGVSNTSVFISLVILGRVVHTLYGERLWCVYNAVVRCACVKRPPDEELLARGRKTRGASVCGRRVVGNCEELLPVMLGAETPLRRSLRLQGQPMVDNQPQD